MPTLYEGDMALTDEQVLALEKNKIRSPNSSQDQEAYTRGAIGNAAYLWPNGIIPFVISENIDADGRQLIRNSMKDWEKHVCVKFKARDKEKGYIQFVYKRGCWSYVGYGGRRQELSLGRFTRDPPCEQGAITHELGHALGFYHEHTRPDRDKYVKILWENIRPGKEVRNNFEKQPAGVIDSRGVEYDFGSLMHYSKFQGNNRPGVETIVPKDPSVDTGQRKGPSKLDVKQARLMYKCDAAAQANKPKPPGSTGATNPSTVSRPPTPSSGPSVPRPPAGGYSGKGCRLLKVTKINTLIHKVEKICSGRRPNENTENKTSSQVR